MGDHFQWGVGFVAGTGLHSLGTSGGYGGKLNLNWGDAGVSSQSLWGLGLSLDASQVKSHTLEQLSASGSFKGASLFVDTRSTREPRTESEKNGLVMGAWMDRTAQGIGVGEFCPATGDCWASLTLDSITSMFVHQWQAKGHGYYHMLSFDIAARSFLHLTSDEERSGIDHPARRVALELRYEFGFFNPSMLEDNGRSLWQEVFTYGMDLANILVSAKTSGNALVGTNKWVQEAYDPEKEAKDHPPETDAKIDLSQLLILQAYSSAGGKRAHIEFYQHHKPLQAYILGGNIIGSLALLVGASQSEGILPAAIAQARHSADLELGPVARFALSQLLTLGSTIVEDDHIRQSILQAGVEGLFLSLGRTQAEKKPTSKTVSYTSWTNCHQEFKKGTLEGSRGGVGIEQAFDSGLSLRTDIHAPYLNIGDGNVVKLGNNLASSLDSIDAMPYENGTLPATVFSAVGLSKTIGDRVTAGASIHGGAIVQMGPGPMEAGVMARVAGNVGVALPGSVANFFSAKKATIALEAFGSAGLLPSSTMTEYGATLMFRMDR